MYKNICLTLCVYKHRKALQLPYQRKCIIDKCELQAFRLYLINKPQTKDDLVNISVIIYITMRMLWNRCTNRQKYKTKTLESAWKYIFLNESWRLYLSNFFPSICKHTHSLYTYSNTHWEHKKKTVKIQNSTRFSRTNQSTYREKLPQHTDTHNNPK